MPTYICPRCNYSTKIKTHLINHYRRKFPCRISYNDVSIEDCVLELDGSNDSNVNANIRNVNVLPEKYKKNIRNVNENIRNVNAGIRNVNANIRNVNAPFEKTVLEDSRHYCTTCPKSFSSRQSKYQHKLCCEKTQNSFQKTEPEPTNEFGQKVTMIRLMEEKLSAKDMIIGELKGQIEVLLKNQGSNNVHTTNQYIVINSFGNENTSYITPKIVNKIINNAPFNTIPKLLEYIHFNPEHKENHNVKIPNKKQNYAQIYNGTDWEYRDKRETIEDMSDRAYNIINTFYKEGTNTYMDTFRRNYDSQEKTIFKRVYRDTEMMILNNQLGEYTKLQPKQLCM